MSDRNNKCELMHKGLEESMHLVRYCVIVLGALSFLIPTSALQAKSVIAVMDFIAKGVSDTEASALTDRLRTELVQTGQYKVVEREMMTAILAE